MEKNISKAAAVLMQVQAELEVPKDQVNDFSHFNYRTAEQILGLVKPILQKHNAALWLSDCVVVLDGRHYVEATAYFAAEGELITCKANAREAETKKGMDVAQITGAASSYARKYALGGLLNINDSNDPDTKDNHTDAEPLFKTETTVATPLFGEQTAVGGVDFNKLREKKEAEKAAVAPVTPESKVEVTDIAPAAPATPTQPVENQAAVVDANVPGAFVEQPAQGGEKGMKDRLQSMLIENNALTTFKNWLQSNGHISMDQEWCDAPINVIERALNNPQKFLQIIGAVA